MVFQMLGSGAADGIPGYWSDDPVCRHARQHGGKNVRTRSSGLLDGVLKIDLPPDTLAQVHRERIDPRSWQAIFFTHSHDDHFAPHELQYFVRPFNEGERFPIAVFGNAAICAKIAAVFTEAPIELVKTCSFKQFRFSAYEVTPIKAYHKLDEDSHNLIFAKDGRRFLYATDTGYWQEETWEFLSGMLLDAVVIECTEGYKRTEYYGHMDINDCLRAVERMRSIDAVREGARIVTTHHSHMGGATHEDLERELLPHGIEPGFDGMQFEV